MSRANLIINTNREQVRQLRLERQRLRDFYDPFQIPENEFKSLYRMPQHLAITLINELIPFIENTTIPIAVRVLIALHFYAKGKCIILLFLFRL